MVRVLENVRGRDVYIIQGINYPVNDNFMELLFWIDAVKLASARRITAVMPFFSYAKGDKKDEPRVSIRARVCADALVAAGVDRVMTLDMHSPQLEGFFRCPVDHLVARPILVDHIKRMALKDLVVASCDVGFGKGAYKFAQALKAPVVIGNKIRKDHSETAEIWQVVGDVRGKNVLIVDDIIFTGSSMIQMAHALVSAGAQDIYAAVTHGVLCSGVQEKLKQSPIKELIATDTVEYQFEPHDSKIKRVSVAGLLAKAIAAVHEDASISEWGS